MFCRVDNLYFGKLRITSPYAANVADRIRTINMFFKKKGNNYIALWGVYDPTIESYLIVDINPAIKEFPEQLRDKKYVTIFKLMELQEDYSCNQDKQIVGKENVIKEKKSIKYQGKELFLGTVVKNEKGIPIYIEPILCTKQDNNAVFDEINEVLYYVSKFEEHSQMVDDKEYVIGKHCLSAFGYNGDIANVDELFNLANDINNSDRFNIHIVIPTSKKII